MNIALFKPENEMIEFYAIFGAIVEAFLMTINRRQFVVAGSGTLLTIPTIGLGAGKQTWNGFDWKVLKKVASKSKAKSLTVLYPQGCLANLKPIIQEFEALTGTKILVKEAGFSDITNQILKSSLLSKSTSEFDIAIPPTFSIPDLAEAKVIHNLSDYAKNYEPDNSQSLLYTLGDYYHDGLFGYQSSGDAYLLFLRKSWLRDPNNQKRYEDRFGSKLDVPMTWEELDRQMSFFHDPEKQRFGGCFYRNKLYMHWEYWIRLHGQGSYPLNKNMRPLLNNDACLNAIEQMKTATTYLHPSSQKNGPYENFSVFGEGQTYANLSWGGGQKFFNAPKSKIRNDLIVTQSPGGILGGKPSQISYFNWGWTFVVGNKAKDPELSYLFCLLATSPKTSSTAVAKAKGFFDPYRTEHFEHGPIAEVYGKPFLAALHASLKTAIPDLYIKAQGQYFAALRQGINSVLYQKVPPKVALGAIVRKWDKITNAQGVEGQKKQWQALMNKYPENLKKHLKG